MTVRVGRRLEVRLDEEHREKLAKVVEARGGSVSGVVRSLIEEAERAVEVAELDALLLRLQETATWSPTQEEIDELLADPQCPELDEVPPW